MEDTSRQFLESLLASIGPSGYEEEPASIWREEAGRFADQIVRDRHGNTDAVLHAGGSPRILLAGHLDEIGFIVTHVEEDGYLRFAPVGRWDPQILQGQRVLFRSAGGRVRGVIGKKPVHLQRGGDRKEVPDVSDLWIDIGAASREEALSSIAVGDPIVLDAPFFELPGGKAVCRGLDDRAGAFSVLEAGRILSSSATPPRGEVHLVATCQEEIGIRGAKTSAFRIDPAVAIVVDVTFATDDPGSRDARSQFGDVKLGGGPVISRGPNIHPRLFDLLVETAQAHEIPYQLIAEPAGTGTDAQEMQVVRGGIATALVSIPLRYMHTPCETVSVQDLVRVARLLAHTVLAIEEAEQFLL